MSTLWTRPFVLAIAATLSIFVAMYLLIPALPPWAAAAGASKAEIGLLVGIYSISALVSRLLVGRWMDRYGRKPFLLSGLVAFITCAALYVVSTTLPTLFTVRIAQGLAWGWITTALGTVIADLAPADRRGEAVGFWGLAPPLAMALGPLAGGILLAARGAELVFLASAAFAAMSLACSSFLTAPRSASPAASRPAHFLRWGWLPAAVLFLSSLSYGAILAFVPIELAAHPGRSGAFFTAYALTMLVSRPLAGRLADRLGRPAVIRPGLLLTAAGVAFLALDPHGPWLWAAAVAYAIGVSLSFLGLMTLTVDLAPLEARGRAMAGFFASYDLAIAFGAVILAPVYERFGFGAMNGVASAAVVVSLVLFVGVKRSGIEKLRS